MRTYATEQKEAATCIVSIKKAPKNNFGCPSLEENEGDTFASQNQKFLHRPQSWHLIWFFLENEISHSSCARNCAKQMKLFFSKIKKNCQLICFFKKCLKS